MKIVIHVEGGIVQGVYSTHHTTGVLLVDFDNLEAEGISRDDRDKILEHATSDLSELSIDELDTKASRP